MTYILAIPGSTPVWPATARTVSTAYPTTLFSSSQNGLAGLEDFHVYPVAPADPPEYDPATHKAVEITPTGSGSTWTQTWSIKPLNPAELTVLNPPQWVQFAAALAQQPALNELMIQLRTRVTDGGYGQALVADMLSVGLGQSSTGLPTTAFMTAWQAAIPLMPEGLPESVATMAAEFNLPPAFIAGLTPTQTTPHHGFRFGADA